MLDWEVCVDILSPSFCLPENRKAVNYFLKWESTELHLVCAWMWRFTRNQAICCKFINCSCWLYCWWLLPPANKWCRTDKDKSDFYFFIFFGGRGIIWDFLVGEEKYMSEFCCKATKFCEITSPGILSLKKKSEENTFRFWQSVAIAGG